jgi:hypothetical protein
MTPPTDLFGLIGAAIVVAAAPLGAPWIRRCPRTKLVALVGGLAIGALVPIGPLPLAAYLRGILGDPSIVTVALLVRILLQPVAGLAPIDVRNRRALQILAAVAGLALYPPGLLGSRFDLYRIGYAHPGFLGVLLFLALGTWFVKLDLITLCVGLAVLAYGMGWQESNNVWDYVLDPFIWLYGLGALLFRATQYALQRAGSNERVPTTR